MHAGRNIASKKFILGVTPYLYRNKQQWRLERRKELAGNTVGVSVVELDISKDPER